MSKVIAIANSKGGVGKTSIAVNLAIALCQKKKRVYLVDADSQGSLSRWANVRRTKIQGNGSLHLPEAPTPRETLHRDLEDKLKNYDFIIVDCGPKDDMVMASALAVCDLAIVPVSPSPLDIWSAGEAMDLVKKRNTLKGKKIDARFLVSRRIVGTVLGNEVRDAIKKWGLPVFKTEISQRISVCESLMVGKGVIEYQPKSTASQEFLNLAKEIQRL